LAGVLLEADFQTLAEFADQLVGIELYCALGICRLLSFKFSTQIQAEWRQER
jgi:hypothetical protein